MMMEQKLKLRTSLNKMSIKFNCLMYIPAAKVMKESQTHSGDAQMTFGYEAFDASGLFWNLAVFWPWMLFHFSHNPTWMSFGDSRRRDDGQSFSYTRRGSPAKGLLTLPCLPGSCWGGGCDLFVVCIRAQTHQHVCTCPGVNMVGERTIFRC